MVCPITSGDHKNHKTYERKLLRKKNRNYTSLTAFYTESVLHDIVERTLTTKYSSMRRPTLYKIRVLCVHNIFFKNNSRTTRTLEICNKRICLLLWTCPYPTASTQASLYLQSPRHYTDVAIRLHISTTYRCGLLLQME